MTARQRALFPDLRALRHGAAAGLFLVSMLASSYALALSEIPEEEAPVPTEENQLGDKVQREQLPPVQPEPEQTPAEPPAEAEQPKPAPDMTVPLPDPIVPPQTPHAIIQPSEDGSDEPIPEVLYDTEQLPEPVARMRKLIMDAALTGEMENLRPILQTGEDGTQLSFGDLPSDPITFLRELSGDDDGQEILAILYEVMSAGFVHLDAGEATDMYVWPYFFAVPLETLDKRQRVELFKLVTAGDYEDMKNFGAYIFYRVGISPEGRWLFFVAGD